MHPVEGNESRGYVSSMEYFLTQWRAYLWYMRIWFWPWDLNADNASLTFSKSLLDPLVIQAAIGNIILIGFSWSIRKKFPAVLFGLVWFYITISPASSVVVLAEAINEHRMYLAYIGFVGGAFTFLFWCAAHFSFSGWVYASLLIGLAIGTQERNRVWANDENLWLDTVEKNPTSGRALNNLALVYIGRGEYRKAIEYLEKCEVHWGTYMYCPLNLGISHFALGKLAESAQNQVNAAAEFKEAEKALEKAYELNPRSVHTNFHLGRVYEELKHDYDKAIELYSRSIDLTGGRYAAAEVRLAACFQKLKRHPAAMAALNKALSLDPSNEIALFEKGKLALELGQLEEASQSYERFLSHHPGDVQGLFNYGLAKQKSADFPFAKKVFEKVVTLDPRSEGGWFNLAHVSEKMGDLRSAYQAVKQLTLLSPANSQYEIRLRELEVKLGNLGGSH